MDTVYRPAGAAPDAGQVTAKTMPANATQRISATQIYRLSDGAALAPLAPGCPVQTLSPDGGTLYCSDATGIRKVSLAGLQ